MFARAVRAAPAAAVAAAALWGPLAADVAHAAGRFAEGTPEYDAAKAFYEGKHQVPLEGQPPKPPALSPEEFRSFTVDSVTAVGRNTSRIRFALPEPTDSLGLTVASCLVAKAQVDGETVVRPYTPITSDRQLGYFDLVVKGYEEGKLSQLLTSVQPGDQVEMKGPWVKLEYKPNMKKAIGMIAGGSGVTPMFQVIRKVLENPRDNTEIRLLYANRSPKDILIKDELDALAATHPNFKVLYTVDETDGEEWTGLTGHVNKAMVAEFLPPPGDDYAVYVCGPPGMYDAISGQRTKDGKQGELTGLLQTMGYTADQVFKF